MLQGILLAGLVLIATVSGKTMLTMLAGVPLIGLLAAWYMGYVEPLIVDGAIANLIYAAMSLQVVLITMLPVFFVYSLARNAIAVFRAGHSTEHQGKLP